MDVFWRNGYALTTPQSLAEEIGIGKGSLYNAFASKHALFELVLHRYSQMQMAALTLVLEAPGPAKARLRTALETAVAIDMADPGRRGCLAVNSAAELASVDEAVKEHVRRLFSQMEEAFQSTIEAGQRSGEIDPSRDATRMASLLVNTVVGIRVMAKTADGPDQLHRIVNAVIETL
jgi:TetR/AcrR family transcriptional regulator, transcriptional repressor for nem operon